MSDDMVCVTYADLAIRYLIGGCLFAAFWLMRSMDYLWRKGSSDGR